MSNTETTPATRNVSVKFFSVTVNGTPCYVKAKSRTGAIRVALEKQDVAVRVLGPSEILDAGLSNADFIDATAVEAPTTEGQ